MGNYPRLLINGEIREIASINWINKKLNYVVVRLDEPDEDEDGVYVELFWANEHPNLEEMIIFEHHHRDSEVK